jgi:hypothetical protein
MTILICSGTLFSGWREVLNKHISPDSFKLSVYAEISALAKEFCQQQFLEPDELDWKPFTPDTKYAKIARQMVSNIENEPLFTWEDVNSSLYLNFWKATTDEAKFALFYSSPEFELSNYIDDHPFDRSRVEKVIDAWVIRTRSMLTFFMNNRERCLLMNIQSADSANETFIQTLNTLLDLNLPPKVSSVPLLSESSPLIGYLATTLLLKNRHVSELYDEVLSAATFISEPDRSISSIEDRNNSLINAFLADVSSYKQLIDRRTELEEELSLNQLQINQMTEELEHYFKKNVELNKSNNTMADYLSNDPLLRVARQARKMQ